MFRLKLFLFSFSLLILPAFLFAADTVTITTYYPSPYGSYKDLYVSNTLGIGTTAPGNPLAVLGGSASAGAPSLSDRTKGIVSFKSYPTTSGVQLNIGGYEASPFAMWMQASYFGDNAAYPIALNPLGGNVGIGTIAPANKLHIAGSGSTPSIKLESTAHDTTSIILKNTSGEWGIRNYNTVADALQFTYGAGADAMTILTSGNVGIGTTGPTCLLNVNVGDPATDTMGIKIGGPSNYNSLFMGIKGSPDYDSYIGSYGNDLHIYSGHWLTAGATAGENHELYFYTSQAGSTNWQTAKMVLDSSGNVGIGTTGPQELLHLESSLPFIELKQTSTSGGSEKGIKFSDKWGQEHIQLVSNLIDDTQGGAFDSKFYIKTVVDGGAMTTRFTIDNAGNVGIGTTSPASKFTVKSASGSYNAGLFLGGTTAASILPHNGIIYLSAGTYYEGGVWQYYRSAGASLFGLSETAGVTWYSGTGDSYSNVASSVALWNATGTWVGPSSRTLKENFTLLNQNDILQKIDQLDVTRWNFKSEGKSITHIGPVAEDFYRIFKTGDAENKLATIDSIGVSLAGVKALSLKAKTQQQQIDKLQQEIDGLKTELRSLK